MSPDARTQSGVKVMDLIRSGALAGVSIGYMYRDSDVTVDKESRTLTANRWRLSEITFTPTQADQGAHVQRSLPETFNNAGNTAFTKDRTMTLEQLIALYGEKHRSLLGKLLGDKKSEADIASAVIAAERAEAIKPPADASDEKARSAEIAKLRMERQITTVAESHGLKGSNYFDAESLDAALVRMTKDKAEAAKTNVDQPMIRAHVSVDALDKKRTLDMVRAFAGNRGENPTEWSRSDLAHYALGNVGRMSCGVRDANTTSSNFVSFVLANAMDKAVMIGFNDFASSTTYQEWTTTRMVPDFKTVTGAALDSGNLVSTAENISFPELAKAEGGYTATASLWGATVSLTFQALVNDDLGEFMNMIGRAGAIAQRTIDKEVYSQLNAATWTGNITSGATLSTAGSIDSIYTAFSVKVGPAGELTGVTPAYLIVAPQNRQAGENVCGISLPPGITTMSSSATRSLKLIVTPQLAQSGITTSTYYVAASPKVSDTVKVIKLQGFDSPVVQEYDAGAQAARKWKILMPFAAKVVQFTSGGTIFFPGLQQGIV